MEAKTPATYWNRAESSMYAGGSAAGGVIPEMDCEWGSKS
jgi:hypothetical protein